MRAIFSDCIEHALARAVYRGPEKFPGAIKTRTGQSGFAFISDAGLYPFQYIYINIKSFPFNQPFAITSLPCLLRFAG